jgi:hypothetical protein
MIDNNTPLHNHKIRAGASVELGAKGYESLRQRIKTAPRPGGHGDAFEGPGQIR